jgi:hypothetical protein
MPRCAICDYTVQGGSALLDKYPNGRNAVTYVQTEQDFLCTDCVQSIRTSKSDYVVRDILRANLSLV